MARMSVDDSALRDPRVLRLAKKVGWSRRETLGALLDVWATCYDRASAFAEAEDIDATAQCDGFAAALCKVGLADDSPAGVRVRGVEDRIAFLKKQAELGRMGGLASAAKRNEDNANQAIAQGSLKRPSSLPLAPDLALASASALAPDLRKEISREKQHGGECERGAAAASPLSVAHDGLFSDLMGGQVPDTAKTENVEPGANGEASEQARGKKARTKKAPAYSEQEERTITVVLERLGKRSGVTYEGAITHKRLIANQLRAGRTEIDLRNVIAYCAEPISRGGLGWQGDPKSSKWLRPETLFGPETIERYLEPARAFVARVYPEVIVRPAALRVVTDDENQLAGGAA